MMWPLPLVLALGSAWAQPPAATLEQLDAALSCLADPARVRSFLVSARVEHADTDGDDAHVEEVLTRVSFDALGARCATVLSRVHDGELVDPEPAPRPRDGDRGELELTVPAGEDLPRYRYGATRAQGELASASIGPAPGDEGSEDLSTGRLTWDPVSLRPLWLEIEPVKLPMMVRSISTRVVLGGSADLPHTARVLSWGVGGVPGFRKSFRLDLRFTEVEAAP